jgi:hypothetical protein
MSLPPLRLRQLLHSSFLLLHSSYFFILHSCFLIRVHPWPFFASFYLHPITSKQNGAFGAVN